MSAPAAISASLVNMRNVGTHKSVALTIHVPEEQAQRVIEAFGWPTMASPVPVAVARLDPNAVSKPAEPKERKAWADLKPSVQAGIRCDEEEFEQFLRVSFSSPVLWETPAEAVRDWCGVSSRKDLDTDHRARVLWHQLDTQYLQHIGRLPHG